MHDFALRIRSLKNKGLVRVQTLVIEASTPSKEGPRILGRINLPPPLLVLSWAGEGVLSRAGGAFAALQRNMFCQPTG